MIDYLHILDAAPVFGSLKIIMTLTVVSASHVWKIFPHKLLAEGKGRPLSAPSNPNNVFRPIRARGWGSAPVKGRGQTTVTMMMVSSHG